MKMFTKSTNMRKIPVMKLVSALVLNMFLLLSLQAQGGLQLIEPTDRQGTVVLPPDPTVIRSQNVIVNFQLLRNSDANQRLIVPVFDGTRLTLIRDRQEPASKDGLVWFGKVENEPISQVVLSVIGETLAGNITTQAGKIYQIRYIGNGVHSLREIDQSKFPQDEPQAEPREKPQERADTCSTDPPTDIDVLVVYTGTTRAAAGGPNAMEATIYLAVAETNLSYFNSNVTQRLRLVHIEEVTYTETGNIQTDVNRLQNGSDSVMDNVQTLRNTYAADLVALIVENGGGYCGIAFDILSTVSNAFENRAYCVVARTCATGYYSFGHELGHLMGARHDCYVDPTSNSPYIYNHGYANPSPTSPATPWRTVMGYNNYCVLNGTNCTRIPYWSNPYVNYPPGDPMGVATGSCQSDNHKALNNDALTVANFRCSSPGVNNVWMKDTWNDTGAEPDSHTASEDMWKSPYIWVRNTKDINLTYQHQHQNPEFGSTNWVYVKLHNGGGVTSGNLELWWANASTGLSWQSNWTMLTTIPVTSFAANSTKVVEAQWINLPGTGHFCMVARWVSSTDPMTYPETSNIDYNVRNNNNIVWRNLNIVDLVQDSLAEASFIIRGNGPTSLVIRAPQNEIQNSFIRYGQLIVQFDDSLLEAWKAGGSKGNGFKVDGNSFVIVGPTNAVIENILLNSRVSGNAKLIFKRLPTTPKRPFVIDAIQLQQESGMVGDSFPIVGGVSYEIHTDEVDKK